MAKKERTLKGALEREKGVDHKKLHQKKLQKQAEKRKAKKQRSEVDVAALEDVVDGADEDEIEVEEFADDAAEADREALAAEIAQMMEKVRGGEEYELETDGSEDAELEVDGEYAEEEEDDGGVELEALDDEGGDEVESDEEEGGELNLETFEDESESDEDETFYTAAGGSPEKARTNGLPTEDDDAEGEDDEDIPLSDIDSLASDEKDDVVPYQRLTINNTAALTRSLKSFALPSSLPFSAVQSITSSTPTQAASIPDPEDDLNRELAFYSQSLSAVREARIALKKEGVPFSRPADYFAEMVKSEEQMGKVRQKMVDEAARKKASSDARRQRDLKKFGKAVQVAKLQERDRAKRETLDKIQSLKRKRQGGTNLTANEDDMFDVALEDAAESEKKDRRDRKDRRLAGGRGGKDDRRASGGDRSRGGDADGPNRKRQKKDEKFGFGGKKRFSKSNDAQSAGEMKGYSVRKMKGGGKGKGGPQRPGKSRRAANF